MKINILTASQIKIIIRTELLKQNSQLNKELDKIRTRLLKIEGENGKT